MQRTILRTITAIAVMCLCYLIPNKMIANDFDYGPEMDPKIITESEEVSLTCPPPLTIDCDEDGIYLSYAEFVANGGSVNLPDGCEVDSFAHVGDTQTSQSGCSFVYMREYFITETCGNTFTCNQIIMLTDDDNPVILNCPSDTTLEVSSLPCTATFTLPTIETVDGCSSVTVTDDAPSVYVIGQTLVTITATDGCGNTSECSFTVTVEDSGTLSVTCPPSITDNSVCDFSEIPAYADYAAFETAGGSASSECTSASSASFSITNVNDVPVGGSCPKTVNRTYTISDAQGKEGTCIQVITIVDDTPPAFMVPADITVDCSAAMDTSITGSPINVLDSCDPIPTVSFADSDTIAGSCAGEFSFTRTWTVIDECLNDSTMTQSISTIDTIAPVVACKDTVTLFLDALGNVTIVPEDLDDGSADACGGPLDFSVDVVMSSCNQVNTPTSVFLKVTDECMNMDSCEVFIVLQDTLSITLTPLENDTIQCIEDLAEPFTNFNDYETFGGGSVDDNCPAGNNFALVESDTTGLCPTVVSRIYEYTDFSGNSDTALHTIIVSDTMPPMILTCPADITITETDICDTLLVFGLPTASDNCGEVSITNNYTNDNSSMATFSGGVTEIVFTVVDACGNSDSCMMTVTLDAPPAITCPELGEINSEEDLPSYTTLQEFLDAGGMINAFCAIDDTTFMYSNSFTIEDDGCTATITENIMVNDTLGNPIVVDKEISIMDTIAPIITNCSNKFVPLIHATCEIDSSFTLPTVSDNFEIDTTYFTIGAIEEDTANVVFYAMDLCGNIDSCEFDLIVYDPTSPDIELDDITIMCDSMGAAPIYTTSAEFLTGPGALLYDCRLDSSTFVHIGDVVGVDGIITRTYSIDDSTGNTGTTIQTITIIDSTDPEFIMCTEDIAVDAETDTCGATIVVPQPTFMDNCGGTITLTNDYTNTNSADGFYPVGVTTVVWTIEDENGLTDTCSFTVTVTDNLIPEIMCPADLTVDCDITNAPAFITIPDFINGGGMVSDNCELVALNSNTVNTSGNIYTRTYTAFDANGLSNECTQLIEVIDVTNPELECVPMIIVNTEPNTCDKFITIDAPTVTDNCNGNITITNSLTGAADPSGVYSDTTTITWYAEDAFGNIDSCTYDIIVVDGTGPVVSDPNPSMVMCEDMIAGVDTFETVQDIIDAGGSASDNCGIEFVNIISEIETGTDTIKRTYAIIDSSGNESTIMHCILLDDTTPPTFDAPDDITIECDDDIQDVNITGTVDSMMFGDNCMDIDTLIFFDIVDAGICPIVNEVSRIWVLTDNSGNETRDTQMISTIDTIVPDFDVIPGMLANIECGDDFPPMEVVTATDDCTGATVLMDTLPFLANTCTGYDVTYRWIAMDGCNNRDTILRSFMVNPDLTPPDIIDVNNQVVDTEADICGVRVENVPGPIFEDDCSGITSLTRNYMDTIYHLGINNVNWTATNACGRARTITQEVIVEDNTLPVVLCKDATAGITDDLQNNVFASSFVASATDNCAVDTILVRRLTEACGEASNDEFGESIHICCDDVGTLVDVEIMVVDESGNENFCEATLQVDDNRAPTVTYPLPNIVVSCAFVIDTSDLEVFGSFTSDPNGREDIVIDDILYDPSNGIAGLDGLVADECDVTISDSTFVNLDNCSNGFIKRIFTFTDGSGNTSVSEQYIVIQDVSPFNSTGNDIIWPEDYTWDQCASPAPDTTISGSPSFLNLDKCAQVSASYKDQIFNYPTTSCPYVKRKWKVIDWCQYDDSGSFNPGLWTYNQFIFVENETPPTIISGCTDTLICAPNNECSAMVSLSIGAEDDCMADSEFMFYSYKIDVNSDSDASNDITGQASSFNLSIENGVHEVYWTVTDRCGNDATCNYTLTVNECKAPTAVCLSGLVIVIDDAGQAELWASDVNQSSSDNCTDADDLIFSFSADVNDFGKTFNCNDVGILQNIEMWVTDLEGNQSFCSTFVEVQDNNGNCDNLDGNEEPNALQGKIATETDNAIPEAMVNILGAEMDDEYMTEEDGSYAFDGIDVQNDYQVKVERDKEDTEGVSTLDLVLIQRHILGLELLDSPYKLIAADVNDNEKVSASDLVALRKVILGIDEAFPENESWRFVSKNSEMNDMENPWPFSEDLIIGNTPMQEIEADFIGVKIGDVNNSVDNFIGPNAIESRNNKSFGIVTRDQNVNRDDEVLVDFSSSVSTALEGLQMTIEWDKSAMNFVDIIPVGLQIEDAFINSDRIEEGIITLAWSSVEYRVVNEDMPLFQLVFEGNESFHLSDKLTITSSVTAALAYDENDVEHDVELRFVQGEKEGLMLFQNKPNPFSTETIVDFVLPEDMEVTFKIFNGAGSLIYNQTQYYTAGNNALKLSKELNDSRGVLFIKMETAEFSEVKRMIRID